MFQNQSGFDNSYFVYIYTTFEWIFLNIFVFQRNVENCLQKIKQFPDKEIVSYWHQWSHSMCSTTVVTCSAPLTQSFSRECALTTTLQKTTARRRIFGIGHRVHFLAIGILAATNSFCGAVELQQSTSINIKVY